MCVPSAAHGGENRCKHDAALLSVSELQTGSSITAALTIATERSCGAPVLHIQASIDKLHELYLASAVIGGVSELAVCSDGVDNDDDGLADAVDPGCVNPRGGSEDSDNTARTSLSWEWASSGSEPEFLKELRWTDADTQNTVLIVNDEPSAQVNGGCRWCNHSHCLSLPQSCLKR